MNLATRQKPQLKSPARRRRLVVLFLMMVLSCTLVMGIVLFSNDMRHLRALAQRFDVQLPVFLAAPLPPAGPSEKRGARVMARANPRILLPAHILAVPDPAAAGAFVSGWRISGPVLCETLKRSGLGVGGWSPAQFGDKAFECQFQSILQRDGDAIQSSIYLVVRGDEAGRINLIRLKLVQPPRDILGRLAPVVYGIFEEVFLLARWPDCSNASASVRRLQNIKVTCSAKSLTLTEETMNPGAFNFFLSYQPRTDEEKRTDNYFGLPWLAGPDTPPSHIPVLAQTPAQPPEQPPSGTAPMNGG